MAILFYNTRGLGAEGRQQQVSDLVVRYGVQFICLQETIKVDISNKIRRLIGGGFTFDWNVKPAMGHFGGMVIAVRTDVFEVLNHSSGDFFVASLVKDRSTNQCWEIINIYGPVLHERKDLFFAEITDKVLSATHPVILGGDFNLIRYDDEKSCGAVHRSLMFKFNYMIDLLRLRELHRGGCKYTWTNKRTCPTMEVLNAEILLKY